MCGVAPLSFTSSTSPTREASLPPECSDCIANDTSINDSKSTILTGTHTNGDLLHKIRPSLTLAINRTFAADSSSRSRSARRLALLSTVLHTPIGRSGKEGLRLRSLAVAHGLIGESGDELERLRWGGHAQTTGPCALPAIRRAQQQTSIFNKFTCPAAAADAAAAALQRPHNRSSSRRRSTGVAAVAIIEEAKGVHG